LWHAPMTPSQVCQTAGKSCKSKSTAKCAPANGKNWQEYTWRSFGATMTLGQPAKHETPWRTTSTPSRSRPRSGHMFRPSSTALRTSGPRATRQIVTYERRGGTLWAIRAIGNGRKTALPWTRTRYPGHRRHAVARPSAGRPHQKLPLSEQSRCAPQLWQKRWQACILAISAEQRGQAVASVEPIPAAPPWCPQTRRARGRGGIYLLRRPARQAPRTF